MIAAAGLRARLPVALILALVVLGAEVASVHAQRASRPASLRLTVVDQLGAMIVGAIVQVVRKGQPEDQAVLTVTDDNGVAEVTGLVPGTYLVRAMYEGFDTVELHDLQLRAGQARRETVSLPISGFLEEVSVGRDRRESSTDPRGDAFTTTLGEQEVDDLPDDPEELERAIEQMAGPGATIRVGGFRGGALPPKSQIREIRFRRNTFAAENHESGNVSVDILTKPGLDSWRGSATFGFRDDTLNSRNALAPRKVDEQQKRGGFTLDGPLWKGKTSLSFSVDLFSAYDTQTILAAVPNGEFNAAFRRPTDRVGVNARIEHAVSKSHVVRGEFQSRDNESDRLGVGEIDLPERAYSRTNSQRVFRLGTNGPVGRKLFNEARLQMRWLDTESLPVSTDPTIRVSGAFNAGGANVQGARAQRDLEIADNLDVSLGKHSVRTGVLVEGAFFDSTVIQNANGTFTFGSLDDYEAGTPRTFGVRQGDPLVDYSMWQFAWYAQDDIRLRKDFTLSVGVRQEWQSHLDDWLNLAPRIGIAWSPYEKGHTTFRGGAGIFYDWYEADTYEQTLQVDGERVSDVVITSPGYPDPWSGGAAVVQPPGVIRQADDMSMPTLRQASIGMERSLGERARLNASYVFRDGVDQLRARATNLPDASGVRSDPALGNIQVVDSAGGITAHQVIVGGNVRLDWHRALLAGNYTLARTQDDGNGPLSLPADSVTPDEWGPARNDLRHRVGLFGNVDLFWNVRLGVNLRAESATPYNITTGFDDNGDTIFTDRPAGVGRNSARGDSVVDLSLRLSWRIGFGQRSTIGAPGGGGPSGGGPQVVIMRRGGDGDMMGGQGMMGGRNDRVAIEIYAQAFNVLNHTNLTGYNGVVSSPLFGQPGSALPPRRIEIGMRVIF